MRTLLAAGLAVIAAGAAVGARDEPEQGWTAYLPEIVVAPPGAVPAPQDEVLFGALDRERFVVSVEDVDPEHPEIQIIR